MYNLLIADEVICESCDIDDAIEYISGLSIYKQSNLMERAGWHVDNDGEA